MSIKFTWLGHGMTLIEYASGPSVLIDPAYDANPYARAAPDLGAVSSVLLTGGGDYCPQGVEIVCQTSPALVVAHPTLCRWVEAQAGQRSKALHRGGSVTDGDLRITMVHAEHTYFMVPPADSAPVHGEGVGYILRHPNHPTVYVSGRTGVFGDMSLIKQLYAPEIALLSMGGRFSMGTDEAVLAVDLLGVKTVFPTHHMSDYERPSLQPVYDKLQAQGGNLHPLDPGQPFAL